MNKKTSHNEIIISCACKFTYCKSGNLIWVDNFSSRARKGNVAGFKATNGYIRVMQDKKCIAIHRIIWYMHHGTFPEQIDHINRNRADNRIENLRDSTQELNCQNTGLRKDNKYGTPGIRTSKNSKKFTAGINVNGKRIHIGSFDKLEDACSAYKTAKSIYHKHVNITYEN